MFDHLKSGQWWDRGIDLVKERYGGLTDLNGRFTGEVQPQWDFLDRIGRARRPQVYTFWNDLFHEGVSFDLGDGQEKFMDEVIIKILTRPEHFYIICTKRPKRALEYFLSRQADRDNWQHCPQLPNAKDILSRRLMLMTTAENQETADLRLPILLQIPGVLHGVSVEPGLGLVDLCQPFAHYLRELDWVVAGPETGPRRRPSETVWFESLLSQCQAAGVPYFQKALEINGKISKNMDEWPSYIRVREVPGV